jgi:hypothetical protein
MVVPLTIHPVFQLVLFEATIRYFDRVRSMCACSGLSPGII